MNDFGRLDFLSIAAIEDEAGLIPVPYIAVRVPGTRFTEITGSTVVPILSALFLTAPFDPSAVQQFPEALLTTGIVNPDGTASVDLVHPRGCVVSWAETSSSPPSSSMTRKGWAAA